MGDNIKRGGGNIAPFSQESFPWKKAVSACFIDGTHIICPTAGYLLAVHVSADATGPGTVEVHDGQTIVDRLVWHERAIGKDGHGTVFKTPVYCDKGITLLVAACTQASVQWIPGPRL